jgi:hypothetical protein
MVQETSGGQLARCLVGERDDEQRLRRDTLVLDEVDDALDKGERLAGARARDDQHRAVGSQDGFQLLWVGLALQVEGGARHSAPSLSAKSVTCPI